MIREDDEPGATPGPAGPRIWDILGSYFEAAGGGPERDREALLAAHPDLAGQLAEFFDLQDDLRRLTEPLRELSLASSAPEGEGSGAGRSRADPGRDHPPSIAGWGGADSPISGEFELVREIARGGMGVVFEARQISLDRPVALKAILAGPLASEGDLRRFRNEAEAVALLDHPNIVPVYHVGEDRGVSYLVMKRISGGSLADRLVDYAESPRSAAEVIAIMARAIHHAHERGILHRDIKPSNILIDDGGMPHLTDFGLAKRVESDGELTHPGAIMGTPAYMAPEQTTGGGRGAVTTASDVYGLGAVLYAMLAGRPPFLGGSPRETMADVRDREPEPPASLNPRVDRDLQTVCLKCLEKDPARRYGSARELADELERWLLGVPILARPASFLHTASLWCRRAERVRDAGVYSMFLGLVLAAWASYGLFLVHTGRLDAERPRVFAFHLVRCIAFIYLPMVGLGWCTILRKSWSMWCGLILGTACVGMSLALSLDWKFDAGSPYTFRDPGLEVAFNSLLLVFSLVFLIAYGLALVAHRSNRAKFRPTR